MRLSASIMTWLVPDRKTRGEIVRFVLVGVKSNILYAVIYVSLTSLGVDHRIALTVVYVFGILYMFVLNKYFVFKEKDGAHFSQFARHLLTYGSMWAMNIAFFQVLSVHFRIHPYLVQALFVAVMIVVVFVLNRYFIFGRNPDVATGGGSG